MPIKKQSKGQCSFCQQEFAKGALTRHLAKCPQRQAVIAKADSKAAGREALYHLQVGDAYRPEFWLHLEMRAAASLKDLDYYLRAIWLECCGHLSEFSYGGLGSQTLAMKRRAGEVFEPGVEITHIYDFGTSSETLVKVAGVRTGQPLTAKPIVLLARNLPVEAACMECGQPAAWLCMECLIEDDVSGVLCDAHAETHPHENYGEPTALVNSPRVGMCGYDGPADPPY